MFRFVVPLLAALMWHLALIGDRHLATGTSWSAMRQSAWMHALFLTTEDLFQAQSLNDGSRAARRRLARAEAGGRRARSVALRTVPPTEMRAQVAAWCEALAAVGDGTADVARLHLADRQRLAGVVVDIDDALAIERAVTEAAVHELTAVSGVSVDTAESRETASTETRKTVTRGPVHGDGGAAIGVSVDKHVDASTETETAMRAGGVDGSTETASIDDRRWDGRSSTETPMDDVVGRRRLTQRWCPRRHRLRPASTETPS